MKIMGRVKKGAVKYTEKFCTNLPKEVNVGVSNYCKEKGVSPAILGRKAIVKFLKEKGFLKEEKDYL